MKLSVLLISFVALTMVLWVFLFVTEVEARPVATRPSAASVAPSAGPAARPLTQGDAFGWRA